MNKDSHDTGDDGLGCQAFGHLTSPFVDGEVPSDELPAFETHLPGCAACLRLVEEYRVIDRLTQPEIPCVDDVAWERAWTDVKETLKQDAEAASEAPLTGVLKFARRLSPSRGLRPLLYLAASLLVAVGLSSLQQDEKPGLEELPKIIASADTPNETMKVATVACEAPGYVPMHYTIGGGLDAEPVTIIQCAWVGTDA